MLRPSWRPNSEIETRLEASGEFRPLKELGNAKKPIETKTETEDASRRPEALQDHRQRQNQARSFRQAPLDGHQSARPHAQAQEVDAREQGRRGQRQADASLRLKTFFESWASKQAPAEENAERKFRNIVLGSASRVPAGR